MRITHVLDAARSAGFGSLEEVLVGLYTTQSFNDDFSVPRLDNLKSHQMQGWCNRFRTMIRRLYQHSPSLPPQPRMVYENTIVGAANGIFKKDFDSFIAPKKTDTFVIPPYLCMPFQDATPNFAASDVLGGVQLAFQHQV